MEVTTNKKLTTERIIKSPHHAIYPKMIPETRLTIGSWSGKAQSSRNAAIRRVTARRQFRKYCRRLHEVVFDFFEDSLFRGTVVHGQGVAKLLHELALLASEAHGQLYRDVHVLIAAAVGVQDRDAFVAQLELRAVLRAFGNLELLRALDRRHFDFAAECGLRHVERNRAMQIVFAALKERMFLDLEKNVEIPGRAAVGAGLAFAGQTQEIGR